MKQPNRNGNFVRRFSTEADMMELSYILSERGLTIYEDPFESNGSSYFIADFHLTYGWFQKNRKRFAISERVFKRTLKYLVDSGGSASAKYSLKVELDPVQ